MAVAAEFWRLSVVRVSHHPFVIAGLDPAIHGANKHDVSGIA
jgi:hypothetical protein